MAETLVQRNGEILQKIFPEKQKKFGKIFEIKYLGKLI